MNGVICKLGETREGRVTVALTRGELTVVIKDVPAQICENCGEYYLADAIANQVLKLAELAASRNAELEILRFAV